MPDLEDEVTDQLARVAEDTLGFLMSKARKDPQEREVVAALQNALDAYHAGKVEEAT